MSKCRWISTASKIIALRSYSGFLATAGSQANPIGGTVVQGKAAFSQPDANSGEFSIIRSDFSVGPAAMATTTLAITGTHIYIVYPVSGTAVMNGLNDTIATLHRYTDVNTQEIWGNPATDLITWSDRILP